MMKLTIAHTSKHVLPAALAGGVSASTGAPQSERLHDDLVVAGKSLLATDRCACSSLKTIR
jgi:hypothetical protein